MELAGLGPVGPLEVLLRGVATDTQHLVEVGGGHDPAPVPSAVIVPTR
jgi:hypothetical protein